MATLGIQQGAAWTLQVLSRLSHESAHQSPKPSNGFNPGRTLVLDSVSLVSEATPRIGRDTQKLCKRVHTPTWGQDRGLKYSQRQLESPAEESAWLTQDRTLTGRQSTAGAGCRGQGAHAGSG